MTNYNNGNYNNRNYRNQGKFKLDTAICSVLTGGAVGLSLDGLLDGNPGQFFSAGLLSIAFATITYLDNALSKENDL